MRASYCCLLFQRLTGACLHCNKGLNIEQDLYLSLHFGEPNKLYYSFSTDFQKF